MRGGGKKPRWFLPALLGWVTMLGLTACGTAAGPSAATSSRPDDAAIGADFRNHQSNVEVTAEGIVVRIFSDRTSSSGTHEQFIIRLTSSNMTVEIEHNISIGQRVPVRSGDDVIVHGEYIWNQEGGLIHFTHHDPQGTHEDGYIIDAGKTYR